jgi:hypothetical protein
LTVCKKTKLLERIKHTMIVNDVVYNFPVTTCIL